MNKFTLEIKTENGTLARTYSLDAFEKIEWQDEIQNMYDVNEGSISDCCFMNVTSQGVCSDCKEHV